jgi:hypothetical protein
VVSRGCKDFCKRAYKDRYVARKHTIVVDQTSMYLQDLGAKYCITCLFYTFEADKDKTCRCCGHKLRIKADGYRKRSINIREKMGLTDHLSLNVCNLLSLHSYVD